MDVHHRSLHGGRGLTSPDRETAREANARSDPVSLDAETECAPELTASAVPSDNTVRRRGISPSRAARAGSHPPEATASRAWGHLPPGGCSWVPSRYQFHQEAAMPALAAYSQ